MISFERKSGEKGILGRIKSHKSLIALIALSPKSCRRILEALSFEAPYTHTHTQFSDFPGESVYTKSFAIAN